MTNSERQRHFLKLKDQVETLTFCEDSIIELGAIKLEAERIARGIENEDYRRYCLNELKQLNTDEFHFLYNEKTKRTFTSARSELSYILNDCYYHRKY